MALYAVSYDLHNQRNYQPLWDALIQAGARRVLESFWLVEVPQGAGELREALRGYIDEDDSVVVIELQRGSNWSACRGQSTGVQWLEQHLRSY